MKRGPDPRELLPLTPVVLHILLALADGRRDQEDAAGRHGYAVAQEVEAMTEGQIRMGPGTLYGSIQRMLTSGLIEEVARTKGARSPAATSDDDERRRYYRLSAFGRRVLQLELARLARVVAAARAKQLLTGPEPA
ncbi:MAG TPA: helix-turn-helix transcriptional regulator [Gemmatimonadaceae bacterium]|nr:helix-turn-helix transcriptional regulator [Gemmatimonadaceae bacterium]